jgi:hypothetical protein
VGLAAARREELGRVEPAREEPVADAGVDRGLDRGVLLIFASASAEARGFSLAHSAVCRMTAMNFAAVARLASYHALVVIQPLIKRVFAMAS